MKNRIKVYQTSSTSDDAFDYIAECLAHGVLEGAWPGATVAYLDTRFRSAPDAKRDLGDQRRACEDYARQYGLHLDACYTDIRASGRLASRTALDRLIADIRRGYVSHVVIAKPIGDGVELARRAGAQADMILAAKRLREAGAIVTVMRHAPTATYQGEERL
jgi:DNA invertase Pin-like site-specific DNA recombinase